MYWLMFTIYIQLFLLFLSFLFFLLNYHFFLCLLFILFLFNHQDGRLFCCVCVCVCIWSSVCQAMQCVVGCHDACECIGKLLDCICGMQSCLYALRVLNTYILMQINLHNFLLVCLWKFLQTHP